MDFRVEHEIKVVRTVLKRVHGPCLMCTRETEYGKRIPPLRLAWLRRQFEPDTLRRDVRAVRIGVAPKAGALPSWRPFSARNGWPAAGGPAEFFQ